MNSSLKRNEIIMFDRRKTERKTTQLTQIGVEYELKNRSFDRLCWQRFTVYNNICYYIIFIKH